MLNNELLAQLKSDLRAQKEKFLGQVKGTNGRFGFVVLDDGREFFLPPEEMDKVLPEDRVEVTLETDPKNDKRQSAAIYALIESSLDRLLGRVIRRGKHLFFEPDHPRLKRWAFIPPKQAMELNEQQYVIAHVSEHPFKQGRFQVRVAEVIGDEETRGIEALYALRKHDLADAFSSEELAAAEALEAPANESFAREDLTALAFVTIDNASTRDMDDALYAEAGDDGWTLYVAIADPDAWIAAGSALDRAAHSRATSIYLPGHTVPMLPPRLSEELCSLKPGEIRLALCCRMQIDTRGHIRDYRFMPVRMRSAAKLSYPEVSAWIDGDPTRLAGLTPEVYRSLEALKALHPALNSNREMHAILFEDRPDFRYELDDALKLKAIHREERSSAQKLVEECMLSANRCASALLSTQPQGLFICHPGFKAERREAIAQLLAEHLSDFAPERLETLDGYKELLGLLEARDDGAALRSILTRSLERSYLSYEPAPHYGLGFESYTTFSSPIRKYQDLCVHRLIKRTFAGAQDSWQADAELPAQLLEAVQTARRACSETERWLCCDYLAAQGEACFSGHIIGVNPNGFNVRLDDNGIVGFVSCKSLEQKFSFDPTYHRLHNDNLQFELDQAVEVSLLEVSQPGRRILFRLRP